MELGENLKKVLGIGQEVVGRTTETIKQGVEAVEETISAPAKWVGEKVGDTAFEATGSPAVAAGSKAVGEVFGDPTNLIPIAKLGALGGVLKTFDGKKLTEVLSDASFAHIFADITQKPQDVKRILEMGKIAPEIREQMLEEAILTRGKGVTNVGTQKGEADPKLLAGLAAGVGATMYSTKEANAPTLPKYASLSYDVTSPTFWEDFKQTWQETEEQRQMRISWMKQSEFKDKLPEVVSNLKKALGKKGLVTGDLRTVLRREYKDLTGESYNASK